MYKHNILTYRLVDSLMLNRNRFVQIGVFPDVLNISADVPEHNERRHENVILFHLLVLYLLISLLNCYIW